MRADRRGAVRIGAAQAKLEARLDVGFGVMLAAVGDDGGLGAGMGAVGVRLARPGLRLVQMHMPVDEAGPDLALIQVDARVRRSRWSDRGDPAIGDAQIQPRQPFGVGRRRRRSSDVAAGTWAFRSQMSLAGQGTRKVMLASDVLASDQTETAEGQNGKLRSPAGLISPTFR